SRPSGRLAIALPPAFCQEILAPNLATFRKMHPEVELELVITGRGVDLVREQIDAAIVVGPQEDSELISKALVAGPLLWVASPAYLAEAGLGPRFSPLTPHVQLIEKRYGLRRMPVQVDGFSAWLDLATGITQVNDPLVVRRAVLNGAGISPLPQFYCQDHIDRGELVQVCDNVVFDPDISRLAVVYPSRRLMSPKVRAFLEFLNTVCRV
ncbi:substrate binding domain-containing protein, partial [Oceanicola sp. S124]|uniref:substrate binding domain-containing protein n=1 Tax=Oceanicola sp. S124 TaxID=1042378 RepID=UPI000255A6BF